MYDRWSPCAWCRNYCGMVIAYQEPRMTQMHPPQNPPNRPPRELINRLIDLIAWSKTCLYITVATAPGNPDREHKLKELQRAVIEPRRIIDEILSNAQEIPEAIFVELRVCELAIPQLEAGAVLRQGPKNGKTS